MTLSLSASGEMKMAIMNIPREEVENAINCIYDIDRSKLDEQEKRNIEQVLSFLLSLVPEKK